MASWANPAATAKGMLARSRRTAFRLRHLRELLGDLLRREAIEAALLFDRDAALKVTGQKMPGVGDGIGADLGRDLFIIAGDHCVPGVGHPFRRFCSSQCLAVNLVSASISDLLTSQFR